MSGQAVLAYTPIEMAVTIGYLLLSNSNMPHRSKPNRGQSILLVFEPGVGAVWPGTKSTQTYRVKNPVTNNIHFH